MASPVQHTFLRDCLPWIFSLLAGTVAAQSQGEQNKPQLPTNLQYVSPLGGYQTYADQPVESWREANDRVGRIGGWRAYAKEIQKEKGEPAKDIPPAADPHTSHHRGGKP